MVLQLSDTMHMMSKFIPNLKAISHFNIYVMEFCLRINHKCYNKTEMFMCVCWLYCLQTILHLLLLLKTRFDNELNVVKSVMMIVYVYFMSGILSSSYTTPENVPPEPL